ncbi:hypothetical protein KFL_009130010 [Klebsormidium nitens]|uniref:Mitochondrial fission 1 protein n=1 Tax=Klebsormidium nitens TaxID=105231 RepID=A0A1Y1IMM4_KLENI|nr:hypothetical protein KFL_009130010 [Klebsormidium nitens]|eukprot:GAQ92054.1 hypothetical protein KFL_009130010 [Klebsormidium nitens]
MLRSLGRVFSGRDETDTLPWTDAKMIADCENAASSDLAGTADSKDSVKNLAYTLVHSTREVDVRRGVAMLETMLGRDTSPLEKREVLYLLAVGHFRLGDYLQSKTLVEHALEMAPDFRQATTLRKIVEDRIAADGLIGIGLAAAAVGVVGAVIAAAAAGGRRR